MTLTVLILLFAVLMCIALLFGCYVAIDRLQTRAEATRGARRWTAIFTAAGVGLVALMVFWGCFALSFALLQAMGLNLKLR